jgi:tetratricopeptide (TPR) repeat protein
MLRNLGGRTAVLVLILVLFGTAVGFFGYAFAQWRAAQLAVTEGRADEARSKLDLCLFLWPNSAEVHLLTARADWLSGDFESAEAHLKQCTRLNNGATESIQLEYLLMRARTGEEDEVASALFKHVDNKHPQTPFILETMSRAYMHGLRYGHAYDCLSRWIKEAPDAAKPYHWRGWILERLSNHHEAKDDYQRALERGPELVDVRLRLVEILLDENKAPEAVPHLERLRRQFPDRPDVMARLGHCRFLQGRLKEARCLLETAVKERPEDSPALLHLGKLELQEGRAAEAEQWLLRSLKLEPGDLVARYTLVTSLQVQGRRDEAAAVLKEYKKLKDLTERVNRLLLDEARHPTKGAEGPSEIGDLLLAIGQEKLALYWLKQALVRDPGHQPTHRALAGYYEKKGDRDQAAAHRRRLLEPATKVAAP